MAADNQSITPKKSTSNSLLRSTYLRYSPTPELYASEPQEAFGIPSPISPSIGRPRVPPSSQRSSEATESSSLQEEKQLEDKAHAEESTAMSNQDTSPGLRSYAAAAGVNGDHNHGISPADRLMEQRHNDFDDHIESTTQSANRSAQPVPVKLEKEFKEYDGNYLTSLEMPADYKEAIEKNKKEDPRRRSAKKASSTSRSDSLASGRKAGEGWRTSAISWAPLNIPLQRRLQTLMVLLHGLTIVGFLSLFLFLCAIPLLWPILVPYMIYCLFSNASTSGELSHRSERLRRSKAWSAFASYYPARLHRCQELPPTRKYLFGYHPHGIISHGAFAAFGTEALGFSQLFPGITNTLLTLESNFRVPIYRDYALALGLASVSRESCDNLLSRGGPNGEGMGRAITIVVGGARESLDAKPGQIKLVLKRRKGFIKLAIRNGADLVPVLGFGENDLYEQFQPDKHPFVHKFQMLVKQWVGFTIPLFHARGVFNYDVGESKKCTCVGICWRAVETNYAHRTPTISSPYQRSRRTPDRSGTTRQA